MALDYDNIFDAIRQSIVDTVGNRLSTINTVDGDIPAIIRERQDGTRPDLPYVTVDIEDTILPSGWLLDTTVQEDGSVRYTILYEIFVAVKAYGDDSKSIMQEYHSLYCIADGVRNQLRADAGLAPHRMDTVQHVPDFLNTNHEERNLLRVSFYVHDEIVFGGYADSLTGEGQFLDEDGSVLKSILLDVKP
jgi:hypothetical protein